MKKRAIAGWTAAVMVMAGILGTTALACYPGYRFPDREESNAELYPWASRACLQQEGDRMWQSQISTSQGDNRQHNALMLRLCELEHSIEALREDLERIEEHR